MISLATVLYIFVLIVCIGMIAFAMFTLIQNFFGIPPYMPSFNGDIKKALQDNFDQKSKDQHAPKFIDLGSGDGKIVFMAAKLGYEAYGVEINPFLVLWCNLRSSLWRGTTPKPKFYMQSYFDHDVSQYDMVFTYLFPHTMGALEEKIFSELKKGGVVISNTFKFKAHNPQKKPVYKNVLVYK